MKKRHFELEHAVRIWLVNKFYENTHMFISKAQGTTQKRTKSRMFPLESCSLSRHGIEETEPCAKDFEDGQYFPLTLSSNITASSNHMQPEQSSQLP